LGGLTKRTGKGGGRRFVHGDQGFRKKRRGFNEDLIRVKKASLHPTVHGRKQWGGERLRGIRTNKVGLKQKVKDKNRTPRCRFLQTVRKNCKGVRNEDRGQCVKDLMGRRLEEKTVHHLF